MTELKGLRADAGAISLLHRGLRRLLGTDETITGRLRGCGDYRPTVWDWRIEREEFEQEKKALPRDYGHYEWDAAPASSAHIAEIRRISRKQVIFGGNYFELPPSSCWLVWDKKNGASDFADCELAWTNLPKAVRRIEWLWNGMIRQGDDFREHPTQKPEGVMLWAIGQAGECDTILDPFLGSGTTAVAAKKLGRHFLGFEISPEYCEIARKRIAIVEAQPTLFEKKPEQQELIL